MNAPATRTSSSTEARNLRWLLDNLVDEVPGVRSVAVVSSDGLLLLSSDPTLGTEHGQEGFGHGKDGSGGAPVGAGAAGAPRGRAPTREPGGSRRPTTSPTSPPPTPPTPPTPPPLPTQPAEPGGADVPPQGPGAAGASEGPRGSSGDLATIVSGVGSLTLGAAKLMDGGKVKQTMVAMDEGALFVMTIGDGSLLGVHATPDCDMNVIGYHMALFVGRAGHVLTPELRSELRESMELDS